MTILVTGGSGFLGKALVDRLRRGEEVASVSRRLPDADQMQEGVSYWPGDVLQPNLGLVGPYKRITAVYHLAGVVNLSLHDKNDLTWRTNVEGTINVVKFCRQHEVGHLFFASSAYTLGRNPYEKSKAEAEKMVASSGLPQITIFKPSIVMGNGDHFRLEHFPQFALTLIKMHRRADLIRRKIEGTLRLPVIEPVFRLKGNPEGKLNIVPVDDVARMMAFVKKPGIFWLTNPNPPRIQDLADWLGEAVLLRLVVAPKFNAMPLEYGFERLTAAFQPYLRGEDDFRSDLFVEKRITKETIAEMVAQVVA
jgi:nucleoside-diphosphate-sugar epimerase